MPSEHDHSVEGIRRRLASGPDVSYLRDWIYGGIDGAITTFAVVSGVAGADLTPRILLILGFSNLLADGFSMAAGNYSGTRSERDEAEHLRQIEERHIDRYPEGETEEVRQIFAARGLEGEDLERLVDAVTADRELWITTMLRDEYGLPEQTRSPLKAGLSTFFAFQLCGAVPLLPYLLEVPSPFLWTAIATGLVFFAIGCMRSRWSPTPWWRAGLGTTAIGGGAAALAYGIGYWLSQLMA